jgi:uncharacterized membrane protein
MYERLPDQIPAHVGPSGVTRWTPRESGVWWVLPLLGSFHAVLMYVLSTLANSGAAGINVPQKKRLLALPPEAQRYAMQPLRAFMFGMATWLLALMLWVQIQCTASRLRPRRSAHGRTACRHVRTDGGGVRRSVFVEPRHSPPH